MGNRAVVCFDEYNDDAIGIYLHWNGGRDSIEGFLNATRQVMGERLGDESYARARLIQVMGNFLGGNLSLGLGKCEDLDCNNFDNGVYIVSSKTLQIIGREFNVGEEQSEFDEEDFAKECLKKMPKKE